MRERKFDLLRQKANEILSDKRSSMRAHSVSKVDEILHELDTYGVELELQNEELIRTCADLEESRAEQLVLLDRFKFLFDLAPVSYLVVDSELIIRNANFEASRLLDATKEELVGTCIGNYLHVDSVAPVKQFITSLFATATVRKCDAMISKSIEVQLEAVIDSSTARNSENRECLLVMTDISNLKSIEKRQAQAITALEEAQTIKSKFMANMSHELRTPLNAIIGFSSLLEDDIETSSGDSCMQDKGVYVQNISKAGKHLLRLINDLMDLTMINLEHLEINKERYSIGDLVNNVVAMYQEILTEKSIVLLPDYTPTEPVYCDYNRIVQVMVNILDNAIKFSSKKGRIGLKVRPYEAAGVIVSLFDEGIGIKWQDQENIFKEFAQVATSSLTNFAGVGIGLALAKEIVTLHSGKIWVESVPGQGSCFSFYLPYSGSSDLKSMDDIEKRSAFNFKFDRSVTQYLVVAEDVATGILLKNILMQKRAMVDTVTSGISALAALREQRPDVILVDLNLPDMSCKNLLSRIKSDIIVIAINPDGKAKAEDCKESGFKGLITGPFNILDLENQIAAILEAKEFTEY